VTQEVSVTGWPAGWPMILTGWLAMARDGGRGGSGRGSG